jgi:hypothetical protein
MTTIADPHVCKLPFTAERTEYAELECHCRRRWYLSLVPYAGRLNGRAELDLGGWEAMAAMVAVSPLFIAVFKVAVFLLAGGWVLFRPPRRRR